MSARERRGYVLLAVLWILVGATASGLALTALARRHVRRARNRRDETEAAWIADGCIARAHAVIDGVLEPATSNAAADTTSWSGLDRGLERSAVQLPAACHVTMRPTGLTLDVNSVDRNTLVRLFQALGMPAARIDSLVDAILDWRDLPDTPHVRATDEDWYTRHGRPPPRHGPFADVRELAHVRGAGDVGGLDSVLGVESDRIVLARAPLAVVAALPGFTDEAVARVAEHRLRGLPIPDLVRFSAELSPEARTALLAHYPELVRATTNEPDAWILTSWASVSGSPVTSVIEVRLAHGATGATVVRRRMWVQ